MSRPPYAAALPAGEPDRSPTRRTARAAAGANPSQAPFRPETIMKLFPWLRRPARPAPARRPTSFRPRLEALEDRCTPSAVGFSTALPYTASATAVDPAGNVAVSTASAVYRFSPSGQLLASKATVPGEGGGIAVDAAGDVYLNNSGVITELDPPLQQTLFSFTLPGTQHGPSAARAQAPARTGQSPWRVGRSTPWGRPWLGCRPPRWRTRPPFRGQPPVCWRPTWR